MYEERDSTGERAYDPALLQISCNREDGRRLGEWPGRKKRLSVVEYAGAGVVGGKPDKQSERKRADAPFRINSFGQCRCSGEPRDLAEDRQSEVDRCRREMSESWGQ